MKKEARILIGVFAVFIVFSSAVTVRTEEISCFYCGMKKSEYGHSWMIVNYNDHSTGEFCSLHCACIDMLMHGEKTAATVLVADYYTKKFIEADQAFWIIGGGKPGVNRKKRRIQFRDQQPDHA